MEDYCKWLKMVLPAVILVFAIWPSQILSVTNSRWVVVVSAALLLVHQFACKKCCNGVCGSEEEVKAKPKRKKK